MGSVFGGLVRLHRNGRWLQAILLCSFLIITWSGDEAAESPIGPSARVRRRKALHSGQEKKQERRKSDGGTRVPRDEDALEGGWEDRGRPVMGLSGPSDPLGMTPKPMVAPLIVPPNPFARTPWTAKASSSKDSDMNRDRGGLSRACLPISDPQLSTTDTSRTKHMSVHMDTCNFSLTQYPACFLLLDNLMWSRAHAKALRIVLGRCRRLR